MYIAFAPRAILSALRRPCCALAGTLEETSLSDLLVVQLSVLQQDVQPSLDHCTHGLIALNCGAHVQQQQHAKETQKSAENLQPSAMEVVGLLASQTGGSQTAQGEGIPAADQQAAAAHRSAAACALDSTAIPAETGLATQAKASAAGHADPGPATEAEAASAKEAEISPATEAGAASAAEAEIGPATEAVAASAKEAEFSPATETEAASAKAAGVSPATEAEAGLATVAEASLAAEAEASAAVLADPGPATEAGAGTAIEAEAGLAADAELCPTTAAQAQQHQPAYQGFRQDLALIEPASAQAQPSSPPTDLQTGQQSPGATAAAVSDSAVQQSESTANLHQMVTDDPESSVRDNTQAGCSESQDRLAAAAAAAAALGSDEAFNEGQPGFVGTQSGNSNGQNDLSPRQAEACSRQQSLHNGQPDCSIGQTSSAHWQPSLSSDQPGHDAEPLQVGCGQQTFNNMQSSASASWPDANSHKGSDVEVQPALLSQLTAAELQMPELVERPQDQLLTSQQIATAASANNSSLESYASLQQANVSPLQLTQKPAASDADTVPQQSEAITAVLTAASELSQPACASEQHSADGFNSKGLLSGCTSESSVHYPGLERSDSFQRQTSQGIPGPALSLLQLYPGLEQPEADSGAMLRHQGLSRSVSCLSQLLPGLEQPNTAQGCPVKGLSRSASAMLPLYPGREQPDTSARQNNQPLQRLLSCTSQLPPGLEQPSNLQRQVAEAFTISVSALLQLWPGLEQADVSHTSLHASELTQALSTLLQVQPELQKPPVPQISEHQEELSRSPSIPLVPNTEGSVTAGDQQDRLSSRSSSAGLQVFPGLEKPESGQSQQDDSWSASLSASPQLYPGLEQPDPQQVLQPTTAETASVSGFSGQLYPGLEQATLHILRQALQSASSQPGACLSSQPSWVYPGLEPVGSSWAQHAQQEGTQSSLSQLAAASTTRDSVTEEHSDHQQVEAVTGVHQVQTEMLGFVELLAFTLSTAPVDLFQGFAGTALQLRLSQGSLHMLFAAASISMYTTLVKSSSSPLSSPALRLTGDTRQLVKSNCLLKDAFAAAGHSLTR